MSEKYCPTCRDIPESTLEDGFQCVTCGRRKSHLAELLRNSPPYQGEPLTKRNVLECGNKQDEDEYAIHDLTIRLSEMTLLKDKYIRTTNSLRDQIEYLEKGIAEWREESFAHKANYEYMAKRCAEQQKEIEDLKLSDKLGAEREDVMKMELRRLRAIEVVAVMLANSAECTDDHYLLLQDLRNAVGGNK